MSDRPRRFLRPICWALGHWMTASLHRPICLRCGRGINA